MAEMKPHLALTVADVDRSVPWEVFTVLEDIQQDSPGAANARCA
jgi:hypothetical protein